MDHDKCAHERKNTGFNQWGDFSRIFYSWLVIIHARKRRRRAGENREEEGGGGECLSVAGLDHLMLDHAPSSRRSLGEEGRGGGKVI